MPELITLIYDAVSDASRWPVFLEAFVGAIGCHAGALLIHGDQSDPAAVCWHGWTEDAIQLYHATYVETDPMRAGTARAAEGFVGCDFEACPREEFEASAAFREFYAPRKYVHSLGGVILETATGRSYLTAHRGANDGPLGEPEKSILRPLMPHLKRAALLHGELGSLRRQLGTFTDHLNRYSHAFLLTDAECRVLYANDPAREVTDARDGLAIDNGQITAMSSRQNAALREAVTELSAGRGASLRRLVLPRPSRRRPYRLMLMPVELSAAIPLGVAVPAVSILVVDADLLLEIDVPVLCELFSLTPAEARVAAKLALGRSVEEIAADAKISIDTVRTHLKRTLSKTGTQRQGELISMILRSVPVRQPHK
jgi:DNA-binding CsgD family transcriptional regulator